MDGKTVRLIVSMPTSTVLETDADFVLLRTVGGDMGILHNHEPSAVMLDYGVLRAFKGKKQVCVLALLGGFATVLDNRVAVLTSLAGPPDKIEEIIESRERERAANMLMEQKTDLEVQRAEAALRHALVHMDVSTYAIIKGNDEITE